MADTDIDTDITLQVRLADLRVSLDSVLAFACQDAFVDAETVDFGEGVLDYLLAALTTLEFDIKDRIAEYHRHSALRFMHCCDDHTNARTISTRKIHASCRWTCD